MAHRAGRAARGDGAAEAAFAATAWIVVCSNPRAANIARAACGMARRVPLDRGPPTPGTGPLRPAGRRGRVT